MQECVNSGADSESQRFSPIQKAIRFWKFQVPPVPSCLGQGGRLGRQLELVQLVVPGAGPVVVEERRRLVVAGVAPVVADGALRLGTERPRARCSRSSLLQSHARLLQTSRRGGLRSQRDQLPQRLCSCFSSLSFSPSRGLPIEGSYTPERRPVNREPSLPLAGHCDATAGGLQVRERGNRALRGDRRPGRGAPRRLSRLVRGDEDTSTCGGSGGKADAGLREEGVDALTLEAYARYTDAARFDDRLTIRARCGDVRGARFRFDYSVERDGAQVADGSTTHACVTVGSHRPTRVPAWLAEAIAGAEAETWPFGPAGGGDCGGGGGGGVPFFFPGRRRRRRRLGQRGSLVP